MQEISNIFYDSFKKRVVFLTKFKGYEVPFSYVYKDLGDAYHLPTNLISLQSFTGITLSDIRRGQKYIF